MEINTIIGIFIMLIGVAYTCIAFLIFEKVRNNSKDKEFKKFILKKIEEQEEKQNGI